MEQLVGVEEGRNEVTTYDGASVFEGYVHEIICYMNEPRNYFRRYSRPSGQGKLD
jgi:hypothetical protein